MLSEKIKQVRREHHLSQEKFAEKLDISRSTVCRWEKGTSNPKPRQMEILISKYGLPTEENTEEIEQDENDIAIAASEISLERGNSEAAIYHNEGFSAEVGFSREDIEKAFLYQRRRKYNMIHHKVTVLCSLTVATVGIFLILIIFLTSKDDGYRDIFYMHVNDTAFFWLLFLSIVFLLMLVLILFCVIKIIGKKWKKVFKNTEMTQNNSF